MGRVQRGHLYACLGTIKSSSNYFHDSMILEHFVSVMDACMLICYLIDGFNCFSSADMSMKLTMYTLLLETNIDHSLNLIYPESSFT